MSAGTIIAMVVPKVITALALWLTCELLRGWYLEREDLRSATLASVLGFIGIRPQDALALEWKHLEGDRLEVIQKSSEGVIRPGSKMGEHRRRRVYVPARWPMTWPSGARPDQVAACYLLAGTGSLAEARLGQLALEVHAPRWPLPRDRPRPLARCFKLAAKLD